MTIELHGIELHGFHGVLEHERREGQRFLVDVELGVVKADRELAVRGRRQHAELQTRTARLGWPRIVDDDAAADDTREKEHEAKEAM